MSNAQGSLSGTGDEFGRKAIARVYAAMASDDESALYLARSACVGQLDLPALLSPRMLGAVRCALATVNAYLATR